MKRVAILFGSSHSSAFVTSGIIDYPLCISMARLTYTVPCMHTAYLMLYRVIYKCTMELAFNVYKNRMRKLFESRELVFVNVDSRIGMSCHFEIFKYKSQIIYVGKWFLSKRFFSVVFD